MKRTIILMFLSAFIISGIVLFDNPDTSASVTEKNGICCQDICITEDGRPKAGCDIIVSGNGLEYPATTDGNGIATVCVEEGLQYTISILCDCDLSGPIPSFTACTKACLQINCE